jgi:hypothetical protein
VTSVRTSDGDTNDLPIDFIPQCSTRLANRSGALSAAIQQIQQNLMLKLGLTSEQEAPGPKALEDYSRLFTKPLSQSHVAALAALFGWHVPDLEQATREDNVLVDPAS